MFCAFCKSFTPNTFCKICSQILSEPSPIVRELEGFKIYSFYGYSEIKELIHSKHQMHGYFIYKNLAKFAFNQFAKSFSLPEKVYALPIDDRVHHGYSHTAILANALRAKNLKPIFHALHATSKISYSGKDLQFRQNNPRNFKILKKITAPVILVDDIVTTGTTILEARNTLEKAGVKVLFALVLADAKH